MQVGFNPTTFKSQTRTYNQDNQLTGSGMVYDGNGNPTTYNGAAMAYDVENRVTSVGVGGTLTNGYRSDGLRAWKQDNQGVRTYFLYDGGNPILELDPSGAVKNVNVFAPDGLVARKEGSTWTYYTFDPQGNVLNKLDSNQNVTAGRLLDAWGQGVETTLPRNIDPWGYNAKWGYYYDRETQLYLCQHRMYDASTGRWLNRDPIGLAGGMNLYGYCASGPVGAVDPSGFGWRRIGGAILGGLLGGIITAGNPLGVAAGAAIFGGLGDAAEQAEENGEVNWGGAATAGLVDGASTYLGTKLLGPVLGRLGPRLSQLLGGSKRAAETTACDLTSAQIPNAVRGNAAEKAALDALEALLDDGYKLARKVRYNTPIGPRTSDGTIYFGQKAIANVEVKSGSGRAIEEYFKDMLGQLSKDRLIEAAGGPPTWIIWW